jgi:hypothetical protein
LCLTLYLFNGSIVLNVEVPGNLIAQVQGIMQLSLLSFTIQTH